MVGWVDPSVTEYASFFIQPDAPVTTVCRYRLVGETLDLAPPYARHPAAHPERILYLSIMARDLDTVGIRMLYRNGSIVSGNVRVDGGQCVVWAASGPKDSPLTGKDDLYPDLHFADVLPLFEDLGCIVLLGPHWNDPD